MAVFGVIIPVMLVLIALLGGVVLAFVLLTVHPALALIPIAVMALAVYAFSRWDQSRNKPSGL